MAIFRVEKNTAYTVMSNHHLRDRSLTLKSKGLLSQILSLPENWDYTLQGLSMINQEGIDAIRAAVKELEKSGYIVRSRERDELGKLQGTEYIIYEKPVLEKPTLDNPMLDNPTLGNPTQLNKEERNKELLNKDQSIHPGSDAMQAENVSESDEIDKIDNLKIIRKNIEYDILRERHPKERIDELYELMVEVVCSRKKDIRIGGEDIPANVAKERFMKIDQFHIAYVLDCISQNTTRVKNIKQYLLTTLYNAPTTMDHYYTAMVNHDLHGKY